jgi:hypothetical protein
MQNIPNQNILHSLTYIETPGYLHDYDLPSGAQYVADSQNALAGHGASEPGTGVVLVTDNTGHYYYTLPAALIYLAYTGDAKAYAVYATSAVHNGSAVIITTIYYVAKTDTYCARYADD